MRRILAVWLFFSATIAGLFAAFGALRTPASLGWSAGISLFLGAIVVPEFEPKLFRHPILWQVCCGVLGFLLAALALDAPLEGYLLALCAGIIFGYAGPLIVKHM